MTKIRTYSELKGFSTFEDRFRYLALKGVVGEATFGFERHVNQEFYRSAQWKRVRRDVIARDFGCDLGVEGYEIYDTIYVHHMNPMTLEEIVDGDARILDPEYLISVTLTTHNAIHYGDERQLPRQFQERRSGDTALWRRR